MNETEKTIDQLKYQAKQLKKKLNISHAEALDKLALERGFKNWALLHREFTKNESSKGSSK